MADRNIAESRRGLAVDPLWHQNPKDIQESDDNSIPLSPQWLLPRAGDNKEFNHHHGSHSDTLKLSVDNEDFSISGKKKNVFKPSHEVESGRWDHWREEERETNSVRRDRRWDGDKQPSETTRRVDHWSEISSKQSGEGRRASAEKRNDFNNRDGDQRRESKWNTRWGPEDKESENWRDKRIDSRRDGDGVHDKAIPYQIGLGKDTNTQGKEIEKDDHHSRSWRSNYFVGRGRGESFQDQSTVSSKQVPFFSHGRVRTENGTSPLSAGHGKLNSSVARTHHLSSFNEKLDVASRDPPTFRYTRMKLLDIYRSTDLKSSKPLDCFLEIPSLMQEETLEPLALSAPTSDELVILKGIDKGDIINSGASQLSKDGSVGKTMADSASSKPKSDSVLPSLDETAMREMIRLESSPYIVPQRSQITGGNIQRSTRDWKDSRSRQQPPEIIEENKVKLIREDSFNSRDALASRKLQSHPSPEDLSLYYKDPQGQIQGPFSGSDLIGWFEAGYFGIDLLVRLANSPPDTPFSLLGDVMPHLRMKSRPPPGFAMAKQIDTLEESHRLKNGGPSIVQTGPDEFENLKNERRGMHEVATEAQSRFLESLMSGNKEFGANLSTGIIPNMGGESGRDVDYLSAQTRLLERQRSSSNPLPYWSGRDAIPSTSTVERISDPLTPYSRVLQPEETSHHLQHSQQVDLLSLLHTAADKSPHPAANPGTSWLNFNESQNQGNAIHGIGFSQDKLGLHHNQLMPSATSQIGFGLQQQNSVASNQPSLSHLITQHADVSSGFLAPEKLPSSDMYQDPVLLSLLQQQYLLSQLQLQSQMSVSPQLSVLDKIMLLQQQQKQEHQQKLLIQQQQLLNHVLSGQQANQQFGDPIFAHSDASITTGNKSLEHYGSQRVNETFQNHQKISSANLNSGQPSYLQNVPKQGIPDVNSLASQPISLPFPHQIFESSLSREQDSPIPRDSDNNFKDSIIQTPVAMENVPVADVLKKHEDVLTTQLSQGLSNVDIDHEADMTSQIDELNAPLCSEDLNNLQPVGQMSSDHASYMSDKVQDLKISSEELSVQHSVELPPQKEVNTAESRDSKKASEKKPRKQKNSKTKVAADNGKGLSKTVSGQKPKNESKSYSPTDSGEITTKFQRDAEDLIVGVDDSILSSAEPEDSENIANDTGNAYKVVEGEAETMLGGRATVTQPSHRAWKSAPGLKPKSLLEIQMEEQLRSQKEGASSEVTPLVTPLNSSSSPWTVVINSENKSNKASSQMFSSTSALSEKNLNVNSRSQLHDLLAEEVLANANEVNTEQFTTNENASTLQLPVPVVSQVELSTADGDDFVEAKDTRKSRRKASKSKGSAVKIPSPVISADTPASAVPAPTDKGNRQVHHDKEPLPAPPGPSLGDFVPWKGDVSSSSPTPAWSLDSGKFQKQTSLRDILREQEKKAVSMPQQVPISLPIPAKSNRSNRGSGTSWQVSVSSPSHLASTSQISSEVAPSMKPKIEDDLFWGPLEQLKTEPKRLDFPTLSSAGSLGVKVGSVKGGLAKGAHGAAPSRGKPSGEVSVDHSLTTTVASGMAASKGRVDFAIKTSEALDFRNWCQNEWVKLTGTNDTSFLEFCIKQSTSEAEMLLRENLGSLDRNHVFIDKFLNYKEFLSPDVIEVAFQTQKSNISSSDSKTRGNSNITVGWDNNDGGPEARNDETARGVGMKKKGKKGQKVSLSALGFNVVSNRIMMGEIQSIE